MILFMFAIDFIKLTHTKTFHFHQALPLITVIQTHKQNDYEPRLKRIYFHPPSPVPKFSLYLQ